MNGNNSNNKSNPIFPVCGVLIHNNYVFHGGIHNSINIFPISSPDKSINFHIADDFLAKFFSNCDNNNS